MGNCEFKSMNTSRGERLQKLGSGSSVYIEPHVMLHLELRKLPVSQGASKVVEYVKKGVFVQA